MTVAWGRRLTRWHDEEGPLHLLNDDGSPACGASYWAMTEPYPHQDGAKCGRCERVRRKREADRERRERWVAHCKRVVGDHEG